jgi:hypothetical protein
MPALHRTRAVYVVSLLGVLAIVQLRAHVEQWLAGYRPLSHAPVRVPYSWDMFAIRLDRCVVGWDPPLDVEGEKVARWHDREPPIEFDTVFNDASWYMAAAARACAYHSPAPTKASLLCFSSDGRSHEYSFACR